MNKPWQLTVLSGKGGTGKTSLVAAFASLAENKVIADCDVDASDLHLLFNPTIRHEVDFMALKTAFIDKSKCVECGLCAQHCRFNAIEDLTVDSLSCEGCGVCELVCPKAAVELRDKVAGKAYLSDTRFGPLSHARLYPGEEASGKLVTLVRDNAKKIAEQEGSDLVIIDGSPGIGCPVIASLSGVDLALVVAEPSLSGIHDLERILEVCEHFEVKPVVCINKYDVNLENTQKIKEFCTQKKVEVVGEIPYDITFTKAQVLGKNIIEYSNNRLAEIVGVIWDEVDDSLRQ